LRKLQLLAFVSFLTLASISTAVSAQDSGAGEQSADQEPAQLQNYYKALNSKDYKAALKLASELELNDSKEARGFRAALRGAALLGLKRDAEAKQAFADAEEFAGTEPAISWLKLEIGLMLERTDVALDALDKMIARFPDQAREINKQSVWYLLRNEPKNQQQSNEDRRIALARIGYGGSDGDYLTQDAVRLLLKRGDAASATELLRYIDEPQLIENMLVLRQYSAIWPALETMAGPGLQNVRRMSVSAAERAYNEAPGSADRLHELINALRHAGRLDEAIALRSKLPATDAAMSAADEDMGWAINNVALALHEAGRSEDADGLFASLNNAKIENADWRVSMVINRLELLVADGKFAKAAELLPITEATDGSPYAKQLVRRLKYCTLSGLGRKEEAAKVLPDMLEHAKDAYHATVDGLLCAGDGDQAEKLMLTALSDDNFQQEFVRALQPVKLTSDDPSIWDERWKQMRERPAVAKEFDRLGRDMPLNFAPSTARPS
jgi:hypothetical protein